MSLYLENFSAARAQENMDTLPVDDVVMLIGVSSRTLRRLSELGALWRVAADAMLLHQNGTCEVCGRVKRRKHAMHMCQGCGRQKFCCRRCTVEAWHAGHKHVCYGRRALGAATVLQRAWRQQLASRQQLEDSEVEREVDSPASDDE